MCTKSNDHPTLNDKLWGNFTNVEYLWTCTCPFSDPGSHNITMGEISFILDIFSALLLNYPSAITEIMPYYYMSRSILWSLGLVAWHSFGLLG